MVFPVQKAPRIEYLNHLCKSNQFDHALKVAYSMDEEGVRIPRDAIYKILQGCSKDLKNATKINTILVHNRLERISVLGDHLIRLFVSCASLNDAQQVFLRIPKPSIYTWNAILSAHSKLGREEAVFDLFLQMKKQGIKPDRVTALCMITACGNMGDIKEGRLMHAYICRCFLRQDMILDSALIDMYAKCGDPYDAYRIFNMLSFKDIVTWGAMIACYARHGHGLAAIGLFLQMQDEGMISNNVVFSSILIACASIGAIEDGWLFHSQIVEASVEDDLVIIDSLVDMYSKCGKLEDAQTLFKHTMNSKDDVLWGSIMSGCMYNNDHQKALEMFEMMLLEGIKPTKVIFFCVLKAASCLGDLLWCMLVHDQLIHRGLEQEHMIMNAVIDMYAKCGLLEEAQKIFDGIMKQDIISWAALMGGYAQHGDSHSVSELCNAMRNHGLCPDRVVILCVLKACSVSANILEGRVIHSEVEKCGLEPDLVLGNALIDMYSKCGFLQEAHHVFDHLHERDDISWSTMISGYVYHEDGCTALALLKDMLKGGAAPGKSVLLISLKACSNIREGLLEGRLLHDQVIRNEFRFDLDIASSLISMYSDLECMEDAIQVFNELPSPDITTWEAIISVLSKYGIGNIFEGRLINHEVLKHKLELNVSVGNFLIGMYAEWQSLDEARKIFDGLKHKDEMSWGIMLAAYIYDGIDLMTLDLFRDDMRLLPGRSMFVCTLKACNRMGSIEQGRLIHFQVIRTGFETDLVVGNTLIDMYSKYGDLREASIIFDELPVHDVVTYSTIMEGLVGHDEFIPALELYHKLQEEGLKADKYVLQCILKVCATLGAVRQGMQAHDTILKENFESGSGITSALVDMYMDCAWVKEAEKVFDVDSHPNIMSWGAIIAGHARQGNYKCVLQSLKVMKRQRIQPTERMFSSILMGFSHGGLLDEGYQCFKSMIEEHNMTPRSEHLNCLVDLFGRVGHLDEAIDFLKAIPTCSDVVAWRSLLAGCCTYGNSELGVGCFDEVIKLQPDNGSAYMLMSSMYANTQMCQDAERIRGSIDVKSTSFDTKNVISENFLTHFQHDDASKELHELGLYKSVNMKNGDKACVGTILDEDSLNLSIFNRESKYLQGANHSRICYVCLPRSSDFQFQSIKSIASWNTLHDIAHIWKAYSFVIILLYTTQCAFHVLHIQ